MRFAAITDSIVDASRVASAFARAGHDATLLLHEHSEYGLQLEGQNALVFDADLRGLSKLDSRMRLQRLARQLRSSEIAFFRFDSSLRRPWDDLFATLEASGRNKLILAAFNPLEGFEVRHGTVFWHGSPLHRTTLARDRLNPVYDANLPELLEREGLGTVALVRDITPQTIGVALEKAKFIIVDGGNRGDAERLVASVPDANAVLWAGGANLARAIGATYPSVSDEFLEPDISCKSTLLAFSGSSPQTMQQFKVLRDAGVQTITFDALELLYGDVLEPFVQRVTQALKRGSCAVSLDFNASTAFGLPATQLQHKARTALADTIQQLSSQQAFENILLCGSPIASSTIRALHAKGTHNSPHSDDMRLLAQNPHRISVRASTDTPQTLLGAYQVLAGL